MRAADNPATCATCATLRDQDALELRTIEIVETSHNACAPVTYYTCRCRSCNACWLAIEVYDELSNHPSAWSWTLQPR
jgi:hypothetical protein